MKRATWCGCGCCKRKPFSILRPKALMLMNRRRIAEHRTSVEERMRAAQKLLAMPPAGNA